MPNEKKPIPPLSIVVPAVLDWDWHTPDEIVAELLEQQEQFGINRFMLAFPSKGYRSVDFPTMAYVEQYARNFKEVRERVAPLGIQCGWWFCGTVKLGHGEEEKCPVWGSAHTRRDVCVANSRARVARTKAL